MPAFPRVIPALVLAQLLLYSSIVRAQTSAEMLRLERSEAAPSFDTVTLHNIVVNARAEEDARSNRLRTALERFSTAQISMQSAAEPSVLQVSEVVIAATGAIAASEALSSGLSSRYAAGVDALDAMKIGVGVVGSIHRTLDFEERMNLLTNPWRDEDFRNFWDGMESWGTVAGLAVGGALFIFGDSKSSQKSAGISIGLAGIAQLLGGRLGQQNGSKFEDKTTFIELTRSAYADLRTRNDLIRAHIQNDSALYDKVAALQARYSSAATTADSADRLVEIDAIVKQYDDVMRELPVIFAQYEVFLNRYGNKMRGIRDAALKDELEGLAGDLKTLRKNYDTQVLANLALTPKVRRVLAGLPLGAEP